MANEFIIKNGFQSRGNSQVTGSLNLSGDMTVGQYITHVGDTDTQINFLDDEIRFEAGNLLLFDIHKKGSAPHEITVNSGGNNVDFIIEDDAGNAYFIADASTTRIGIGTTTPEEALTVTGNISASGNISTLSHITASGNISASGTFIGDGSTLTNLQRPITTVGTNPFTASAANEGQYFRVGGNITCSIFPTASATCTVGAEFEFIQTASAGNLLFETASGVTFNSKDGNMKLSGQFSAATLKYVGNDEWDLIGDLG
jgi:hypothetical protein